ncbi:cellular nucleic acid binding protein [Tanacetum coccineum]
MAGVPNSCDGSSGPSSAGRGNGHGPISHDSDDDEEVHACLKCGASDHVADSCTNEGLSTYYYDDDDDEVHSCFKCGANDHVADDPCPNEGRVI